MNKSGTNVFKKILNNTIQIIYMDYNQNHFLTIEYNLNLLLLIFITLPIVKLPKNKYQDHSD
jgi:hypothetical protein